jgi:6-phospho-3-hexuloisomerase
MKPQSLSEMNGLALDELRAVIERIDESQVDELLGVLAAARRIACYGVGREGLMMKALAMRLYHMGLDVHMVGDMTTPPLAAGDLLLVSAGPGHFSTVQALLETARAGGAKTACFTAEPGGVSPTFADHMLVLPAQTMARDQGAPTSFLPMGSLYEGVQYLVFEYLVLLLRDRLGVTAEAMRGRHTNLE